MLIPALPPPQTLRTVTNSTRELLGGMNTTTGYGLTLPLPLPLVVSGVFDSVIHVFAMASSGGSADRVRVKGLSAKFKVNPTLTLTLTGI